MIVLRHKNSHRIRDALKNLKMASEVRSSYVDEIHLIVIYDEKSKKETAWQSIKNVRYMNTPVRKEI